jgi:hypothetical protein
MVQTRATEDAVLDIPEGSASRGRGRGQVSYPVFKAKPSTHRMYDPGSIVPHIRTKNVHR